MKKILFITLTFVAITSCSKTQSVYEPAGEIMISPVRENVTKSMMHSSNGVFLGDSFNVWAWFNPVGAKSAAVSDFQSGWSDQSTSLYVDEKTFVPKNNGKWGGRVAYYWPNVGSLVFAGYHAPNLTGSDAVTYVFDAQNNKMLFSNVQMATVVPPTTTGEGENAVTTTTYAEDIMYFNMTPSSYNNSSLDVSVKFKHALSWITVTLSKRSDPVINAIITVKNVSFSEVVPEGNGVVDGQSDIEWTVDETEADVCDILSTPKVIDYDITEEGGETKYKAKIYVLDEYLFIPQAINGVLSITYSVMSEDDSEFEETYEVHLGNLKDGHAQTEWEPGKHYTYNLSIGTDEITVTPKIDDWDPVSEDILIPLPEDMYDQGDADDARR